MADLLIDSKARPIPQILEDDEVTYIAWKGKNGSGFVYVPDGYDEALGSTADTSAAATLNGNILKIVDALGDGTNANLDALIADVEGLAADVATLKADTALVKAGVADILEALLDEVMTTKTYSRPSIFSRAARTGTNISGPLQPDGRDFGVFFVDVTALDAGATLTITVETKDGLSGKWFPVITDPATVVLSSISNVSFFVMRGLGYTYQVKSVVTGGNVTFSVGAIIK